MACEGRAARLTSMPHFTLKTSGEEMGRDTSRKIFHENMRLLGAAGMCDALIACREQTCTALWHDFDVHPA